MKATLGTERSALLELSHLLQDRRNGPDLNPQQIYKLIKNSLSGTLVLLPREDNLLV